MALVNMKDMLSEARKEKRAVGAFNTANYELSRAILKAAEAENQPVIIQLYMRLFDSEKAYDLCGMLQRLATRAKVPVALHLDHGATIKQAKDALAWGYTSVMYDGSRDPFAKNVQDTAFVAQYAHAVGATCEGEIGFEKKGERGFGYDPLFICPQLNGLTFAEAGEEQKNRISHRANAIRALKRALEAEA